MNIQILSTIISASIIVFFQILIFELGKKNQRKKELKHKKIEVIEKFLTTVPSKTLSYDSITKIFINSIYLYFYDSDEIISTCNDFSHCLSIKDDSERQKKFSLLRNKLTSLILVNIGCRGTGIFMN